MVGKSGIPILAVAVLLLVLVSPASAQTSVTVRLVDQHGVEHTLGQICASGVCTISGGTLNLVVGTTYTFTLVPSASNNRTGEQAFHGGYLSRAETRTVGPADRGVFVWDRAVWSPIDLVDQDGVSHSKGSFSARYAWRGQVGDEMRIPVTTVPNVTFGDGYVVSVVPSASNDRTGEQGFHPAYFNRAETRTVGPADRGVFVWDRAAGVLVVIRDDVDPVPGTTVYASRAWRAVSNDIVRIPVTEGASSSGYDISGTTGDTFAPYSLDDVIVISSGFLQPAVFVLNDTKYEMVIKSLNEPPVADAGLDQTIIVGNTALLDGTGSSDPDEGDTLSHSWTLQSVPAGSSATLVDPGSPTPSLSPDVPGDYAVQLVVSDGAANSPPDQVTITAAPLGNAIQNLIGLVDGMGLPKGVQNSLTAPLKQAADILSDDNPKNDGAACGKLNALINQVDAKQGNGQLTEAQASQLRSAVLAIKAALGCRR